MHPKAKQFVEGRKGLFQEIKSKVDPSLHPIWFHFASLGEFEQGRTVLEEIKKKYSQKKLLITFYSPSGYEIRKNTELADYVFYLPVDTAPNARYFLDLIQPEFVVFTKYEYWFHFFNELGKRNIPLLMISAIYREDQVFFKPWGGFFRKTLKNVTYFFVQNEESKALLSKIGFKNVSVTGDTRFDRVFQLSKQPKEVPFITQFINGSSCMIAGSTWKADERVLANTLLRSDKMKLVIAPHEVYADHIAEIQQLFQHSILYSELKSGKDLSEDCRVLIIDGIGILSYLYTYGDIAYIGGGFGAGIHNTLEAATFGKPVIFGPNYYKFQEAKDLIECGAGYSISNEDEFQGVLQEFTKEDKLNFASQSARRYVRGKAGATDIILMYIQTSGLIKS